MTRIHALRFLILRAYARRASFVRTIADLFPLRSSIQFRHQHQSPDDRYERNAAKYWDNFYQRHGNKFFKDRHYLEKDWGKYFSDNNSSENGKVILGVGCGAGNTVFPLVAAYPKLYVHACDFSRHAVELVKSHVGFRESQINAFVCDPTIDHLSEKIDPSSVDVVTLIFMLSAVSPGKMPLILRNIKRVLKPNGYVLVRDYALGDYAQVKLQERKQMLSEDFYVRGDGTCSFYFSESVLMNLFLEAGFNLVDIDTYCKRVENRLRDVTMDRRWVRAIFNSTGCSCPDSVLIQDGT